MDKNKTEFYFKIPQILKINAIIVCFVSFFVILVCLLLSTDYSNQYRYIQVMLYITVCLHNIFLCSESFRRDPKTRFYSSFMGISSIAVLFSIFDAFYMWTREPFVTILEGIYSIVNIISIRIVYVAKKEEKITFDITVAVSS
ncbi:hypothetical protein ACKWTF_016483 [Chironomus riparius]